MGWIYGMFRIQPAMWVTALMHSLFLAVPLELRSCPRAFDHRFHDARCLRLLGNLRR